MKLIGIVVRAYYNKDNQKIIQINEDIRKALSNYEDVSIISILPTNDMYYVDCDMGNDKIDNIDKNKLDYILDMCDGFMVPGGTYWYNFDEYIMEYAIKKDKPMLCICAGFQALCSMYSIDRNKFDMTSKIGNDSHHGNRDEYKHSIKIVPNTKLYSIIDCDSIKVNSLHNDCVNFNMKDLVISSYSDDNIIESVELPNNKFILGVQWHPEYLRDDSSKKIIDSFIDNVKE